jgi:hypothetical protein
MAATLTVTRTTQLKVGGDQDNDGLFDPGDIVTIRLRITNTGPDEAQNVSVTDTLNGLTLDPATIKATPIAYDDTLATIMGNVPVIISKAALLGNDQDPDGLESALTITGTSNVTGGTLADNGDGTFTFTPTTGFNGTASFQYTITDAQGLQSVSTGIVSIPVSNLAWFVDSAYAGANGASDGSYLRPFTSFQPLNDDGTVSGPGGADGVRGDDDVDGAGNLIFVYNRGVTYTSGITLENNQSLYGDGHEFSINNINIGAAGQTTGPTISYSTYGITLASGNEIRGVTLSGGAGTAVGIQDGGATVGSLFIDKTSIGGQGQIIDIDQGGSLNVTLTSASSSGSTSTNGGVVDLTGVSGAFTVSGATTINGTHSQNGLDISGNNNFQVAFQGMTTLSTTTNTAANLTSNAGTSTFSFAGLSVTTTSGMGLNWTDSGTLIVTGASNSMSTGTGRMVNAQNGVIGGGGVNFQTMTASGTVSGHVISLDNVDTGTFNGGNLSVATGVNAGDVLRIVNGSSANATFGSFTSGALQSGNDAIEINASSGTYNFTGNVTINSTVGNGITLVNNTGGSTTLSGGNLNLDTTSGTALSATHGTTAGLHALTISGANNSIASTTGKAIEVNRVTLNATLKDVSASGGTNTAVFLKDTGASGQFVVTGTGTTAASGGIISNIGGTDVGSAGGQALTGTGIYMENVSNVSLSNMRFGATGGTMNNYGIRGEQVTNFTLRDSEFLGTFGTNGGQDEATIRFGTGGNSTSGLKGTGLFEGNNIQGGIEDNLRVYVAGSDTLNLTIRDTAGGDQAVFGTNSTTSGNSAVSIRSANTSNVTVLIDGAQFTASRSMTVDISAIDNSTMNATVRNSAFSNSMSNAAITDINAGTGVVAGQGHVSMTGGGTGNYNFTYLVENNTMVGARSSPIYIAMGGTNGTASGRILNNTIGTNDGLYAGNGTYTDSDRETMGAWDSGTAGIFVISEKFAGNSTVNHAIRIEGNNIQDIRDGTGSIWLKSGQQDSQGVMRLEATIKNNILDEAAPNQAAGIYAQLAGTGGTSFDAAKMGLEISGNTINMTASSFTYGIQLDHGSTPSRYHIPGYGGATSGATGATAGLENFWVTTKGNNITVGASVTKTEASSTHDIQNTAFTLAVPAFAAPTAGYGWEDLVPEKSVDNPTVDTGAEGGSGGDGGGTIGSGTEAAGIEDGTGTGGSGGGSTPASNGTITDADLGAIVEAAIARWAAAGATPEQIEAMRAVKVSVTDMVGSWIGSSEAGAIRIDSDGAGYGWFVDSTPGEDSEFAGSDGYLKALAGSAADGRMDLLTVVMHELGHQIGLDDDYQTGEADELMYGYVNPGERRLPEADEVAQAGGSAVTGAYALTPVAIGGIPNGKSVDVIFDATIDQQTDKLISNLNNTATASGSNLTANATGNETTTLDTLTLGNLVFKDVDYSGGFNAGDTGLVGVTLELYADTDDSGGFNAGDVLLASTVSGAGGAYSFTGLAPGDYIVVIKAAEFGAGKPLVGLETLAGGADPDDNVDNDDNGIVVGSDIASQTITLSYNNEPTAGTGNDTNNTLDFGFKVNRPPVAVDDAATVDEDSVDNVIAVLGNDTDPDGDTLSVSAVSNPVNGTVSLTGGVIKFTPTANFNGTATFDYTLSDGKGNSDTGTATITVTAVNDPIGTVAPGAVQLNEDTVDFAVTGMSITDVDAALAPSGVYSVTLAATQGTLTLTTTTGLTFDTNDGTSDTTMTFHGTLADINAALATAKYTPPANYHGTPQIQFTATDEYNNVVATGTGASTADGNTINVTVHSVNDAPEGGSSNAAAPTEGTVYTFTAADFSAGMTDANDSPANAFAGVKITTLPGAAAGVIKLNGTAISAGDTITKTQLDNNELTFEPAASSGGTAPTFTFQVQDNGGTANGGVDLDQSANTFTLNIAAVSTQAAPVIANLQGDDVGFLEGSTPQYADAGGNASVTDADSADFDTGTLTVAITANGVAAEDVLAPGTDADFTIVGNEIKYAGLTVATFAGGSNGNPLVITFTAEATPARVSTILTLVNYDNVNDLNPSTAQRTITWTLTDGDGGTVQRTSTITVVGANDSPDGTSAAISATEDTFRVLTAADFGFTDPDTGDTMSAVTITAVNGAGQLYYDADGTAGAGAPVAVASFPQTYTVAELAAGSVSYRAPANANGNALATIDFQVVDSAGAGNSTDPVGNVLTVNVAAAADAPVAQPDNVATPENQVLNGDLFANNGNGVDSDADGDAMTIDEVKVNGSAITIGAEYIMPSGAKLTVNADGTFSYDPNGKFNYQISSATAAATGAVNDGQTESFTYRVAGGNTVTVIVNVTGVDGAGDQLWGNAGDNTITGTPQGNSFRLQQGGDDTAYGLGGRDGFFFGAALTSADVVDGGAESDQLGLQGDYSAGTTLGQITNVETIVLLSGSDTRFGDTANNLYSYNLTSIDANVAAGERLYVDGAQLKAGENFTFNGSAETDGRFFFWAGLGTDTLTGGAGNDAFLFRGDGVLAASDSINGGAGKDEMGLRGNYAGGNALTFGANTISGIEVLTVMSGQDTRFGPAVGNLSYDLTLHNSNVAAGQTLTVDGGSLGSSETLRVNGAAETNGHFKLYGGAGNDVLIGGSGNDLLRGNSGGDHLTGGGGNDRFQYLSVSDAIANVSVDTIFDFALGDLLDLSGIDADSNTEGNQAFTFIGSNAFTDQAGQLRAGLVFGNTWLVEADVNGDGDADFQLVVNVSDAHPLTSSDFLL